MSFTTTPQEIIDSARIRHWTFSQLQGGDGAAFLYLNQRLRTHVAQHGAKIEGLVGTSMTYDLATIDGLLVAESSGVPVYTTTYGDGWPVHDDGGVPYVDFTEPAIAVDPFGVNGGTPGFPLPGEMIRLIAVSLLYSTPPGLLLPCDVIPEGQRFSAQPGRNPTAFVSGNRLVPNLPFYPGSSSTNSSDRWFTVSQVFISYVALQTLANLTDPLNLPAVLVDALIADMAAYLAYQAKDCPAADKKDFAAEALRCTQLIKDGALDMLNEPLNSNVHYLG